MSLALRHGVSFKTAGADPPGLRPRHRHASTQKILGRFSVDRCFCQLAEEDIRFLFFLQIFVEQCCRILQPKPSCPGFQSSVARYFVMFDCLSGREQTRIKRTAIFIIFDDFLALFENAPSNGNVTAAVIASAGSLASPRKMS